MPHPDPCPTCRRITAAHKAGTTGRNDLAKRLNLALATITNHAKHCGITFDRSKTAVAVAARQIDLRARRQAIVQRLYGRTEAVLDRLEADVYRYTIAVAGQGLEHVDDSAPPAQDERALSNAITAYLQSAARLEQVDADGNTGEVHSVLDTLAEGFARAAAGYQPTADDLDP